jgi:hypothetical protein
LTVKIILDASKKAVWAEKHRLAGLALVRRTALPWIGLSLIAAGYILAFTVLSGIRLFYPYELEWIEGAMLDQMRWILQGQPLYGPPDIHFIPFAYTPLYFYLSAGLMKWIGTAFIAPRLISILSTLGCFLAIYVIVKKAAHHPLAGIIAAGIYAATFQLTGLWLDLAKVDSLFMLFVLLAYLTSRQSQNKLLLLVSGVLFALAFFTKQLAFPLVLLLAPISLLTERGKTWPVWATTLVMVFGVYAGSDRLTGGWFSFYTIRTILAHPRVAGWWPFWQALLPRMWPLLLIAIILLSDRSYLSIHHSKVNLRERWNLYGFIAALILTSWSIYFKVWTYRNDLIPACAGLAILGGLAAGDLITRTQANPSIEKRGPSFTHLLVVILLFAQFVTLIYNPKEVLPDDKIYRKSERIVQRLQSLPGEVLIFSHGTVAFLAGKTSYLNSTPLGDVFAARFSPGTDAAIRKTRTENTLNGAISDQIFDWIVVDEVRAGWLPYYLAAGNFVRDNGAHYPGRTAEKIPRHLLSKNPVAKGGDLPLADRRYDGLFVEGWAEPSKTSRGIEQLSASLKIALVDERSYRMWVEAIPLCSSGQPAMDAIVLNWDGLEIGRIYFRTCQPISGWFVIPAESIRGKAYSDIRFDLRPNPDSSHDSGLNSGPLVEILTLRFAEIQP